MINELFYQKFPFSANYFSNLLKLVFENKRNFPQSIIFEGTDTKTQYLFALELARILNCQKEKEQNCTCTNCKWIKSHSHPSVVNVSQIHFKPDGDETKTIISTKQAQEIERVLTLSSDYYRFFIFFSSKNTQYDEYELNEFDKLGYDSKIDYSIEPIDYSTFHTKTLNALLKSVEEPAQNTAFIFLTKSKEDILPTIVSRSQVFKLSGEVKNVDYSQINEITKEYLKINYNNAFLLSEKMQNIISEQNIKTEEILYQFLEYLKDLLKQNIDNSNLALKIKNDIEIIKNACLQLRANMSEKTILDTMFLKLARGY